MVDESIWRAVERESNKTRAAKILGIGRRTVYTHLEHRNWLSDEWRPQQPSAPSGQRQIVSVERRHSWVAANPHGDSQVEVEGLILVAEEGVEIRILKRQGKSIREIASGASPYREDGADKSANSAW